MNDQERILQLEKDLHESQKQVKMLTNRAAHLRIKELEGERDVHRAAAVLYERTAKLKEQRIVEARKILSLYLEGAGSCGVYDIRKALDVLNGEGAQ